MKKLLSILGAAAVGYVAGRLVAPKSGVETRQDLHKAAQKAKQVGAAKAKEAKVVYNESAGHIKQGFGEVAREAKDFAAKAKDSAGKIGVEARQLGAEAKQHVASAAGSAARTGRHVSRSVRQLK